MKAKTPQTAEPIHEGLSFRGLCMAVDKPVGVAVTGVDSVEATPFTPSESRIVGSERESRADGSFVRFLCRTYSIITFKVFNHPPAQRSVPLRL